MKNFFLFVFLFIAIIAPSHQAQEFTIPFNVPGFESKLDLLNPYPVPLSNRDNNAAEFTQYSREYNVLDFYLQETQIYYLWSGSDWTPQTKTTYSYVNTSQLGELLLQTWNGSAWENNQRSTYSYNGNNLNTNILTEVWTGSAWQNASQLNYEYDGSNRVSIYTQQTWSGSQWDNSFRILYAYTAGGDVESTTQQQWDAGAWKNFFLSSYTYNADHYITQNLSQIWNGASWDNTSKADYTYDSENKVTNVVSSIWLGGMWQASSQTIYSYNANDYISEVVVQNWDFISSQWKNYLKYSYEYDGNNNITLNLSQSWDGAGWVNEDQTLSTYNGFQVATNTTQYWDSGAWQNSNYDVYSYDANENLIEILYQQWLGSAFENYAKVVYTYIPVTDVNEEQSVVNTFALDQNYPNPFNPTTSFEYSLPFESAVEISVFNILGEKVSELVNEQITAGNHSVNFNASNLVSGIYIYTIKARTILGEGNYIAAKKMLLLK